MSTSSRIAKWGTASAPHHAGVACTSYGKMTGTARSMVGLGSTLLEQGWLTELAAAEFLGLSIFELRRSNRRRKSVAPGVRLYEVS